jgi:prevent-host-death family protein
MDALLAQEEEPMTETVATIEIRKHLGDILNRVALRHDEFVVVRKGRPLAALVPAEKLEQMRSVARQEWLRLLARRRRRGEATQAEADALADEAKHGGRRARTRVAGR